MPEYLAPGVYIEEVPSGPVPIEGVSTSTAGFVGQTERGPMAPTFVGSFTEYRRIFGDPTDITTSYLGFAVQGFFANGGKRAFVARVVGEKAKAAAASDFISGYTIKAIGAGKWGDKLFFSIGRGSLSKSTEGGSETGSFEQFKLEIAWHKEAPDDDEMFDPTKREKYRPPDYYEVFDNLSVKPDHPDNVTTAINGVSQLVSIERSNTDLDLKGPEQAAFSKDQRLAGGDDGKITSAAFEGFTEEGGAPLPPEKFTGLAGIGAIRDVSILVVPDNLTSDSTKLTDSIIAQCEDQKDRFAVLNFSVDQNKDLVGQSVLKDSSYGAVYAPWVRILDPKDPTGRSTLTIPPCGHIAGVYARTDIERGVHKAPANEVLRGIVLQDRGSDKPLVPIVSRGDQEILNPKNINIIRDFRPEGRDIRVWGSRTMSSNGQWRYVPVRRLFIFIEQSVELATQWVVFEPNSEFTWIRVVASVSNFLGTQWRNGALFGATPEEAYFVKCDRTTMTPDDIDNGRLICLVGIAPKKPAEFVIFRFSQKTIEAHG